MAETSGSEGPQIEGKVAFYQKPEPLSVERHGDLGVARVAKPMLFAATSHVLPITIGEFGQAALDYPVIFTGDDNVPLVVLGLRQGENFFITEEGDYATDCYVPAFIRRYPFVFAEDAANERFVACVDVGSPSVQKDADFPFFQDGKATKYTQDAIEFLKAYEQQRRQTASFSQRLKDLDLFEPKTVRYTPTNPDGTPGQTVDVANYIGVAGDKLNQLPADEFAKLRDDGLLPLIYAHAMSLANWQKLINIAGRRFTPQTTN